MVCRLQGVDQLVETEQPEETSIRQFSKDYAAKSWIDDRMQFLRASEVLGEKLSQRAERPMSNDRLLDLMLPGIKANANWWGCLCWQDEYETQTNGLFWWVPDMVDVG